MDDLHAAMGGADALGEAEAGARELEVEEADELRDVADVEEEELPSDRIADLVELLVLGLVDDVDSVALDVTDGPEGSLIEITVAPDDVGKVIGRRGRTIKSIRTLARALGQRLETEVEVEVLG